MANIVDFSGGRDEDRAAEAPARLTITDRILSANTLVQSIVPTLGALIKSIGLPALILFIVLLNLSAISNAVGELPGMATRLKSFEGVGFKAELIRADDVRPAFNEIENAPEVAKVIRKLAPEQFDRLVFAVEGTESCLYTNSPAEIYRFVAIDHELQVLELFKLKNAPELVAKFKSDTSAEAQKAGADFGEPIRCYTIEPTKLGWQAKNAVIKIVSQKFNTRIDLR